MQIVGHHEHYHKDKAWIELLHDGDSVTLTADNTEALLIRRIDHRTKDGKEIDGYPKETLYGLVGAGVPVGAKIPWDTQPDKLPGTTITLKNNETAGQGDNNISIYILQAVTATTTNGTASFSGVDPVSVIDPQKFTLDYTPYDKPADFPWWMLVAAVGVGLTIVIILYLWKSGRLTGRPVSGAPAAPAPSVAPAVTVVKV